MLTIQQIKKQVDEQKKKTQALAKLKAPVGQTNVEARAERLSLPKPVLAPKVAKPTWTEAKAPVTAASQQRDLALAKKVVSTTPGALAYGVARGISAPVTATAKLAGYQEPPEEAAVRTLAESKRLTSQMDVSKGMGAPQIIQGREASPEMIGRVAGSILPFSAAESAVGRVLPSLAGQGIAKTATRGAIAGGALQGLEEAGQGKRGAELAKSVAIGTALGAGADVGLGYLGKAIRNIKSGQKVADAVAEIAQKAPETKVTIQQELGLPEGATWADIERKMEAEAKRADLDKQVEQYYQSLEGRVAPTVKEQPKPFTGTEQYGVPSGKTYEQFAYEQEQSRLADEYMQLLDEGVSAGEAARRVYPGKPFSGTEQYGIPEGMDYATYQKKLDEEAAVNDYYKALEENPEMPALPKQPERVPSLYPQTPDRITQRISDVGIPQGIVPKAPYLSPAPKAPVPPPRIPNMPNVERELFPSVMRQPTPSPKLPEPALKTAYERANAQRQAITPELAKNAPQGDITPMAAQRMEQEVPDLGIAPRVTPKVEPIVGDVKPRTAKQQVDIEAITEPGTRERGLSKNVATDLNRPQQTIDSFNDDPVFYEKLSNKTTLNKAQSILDKGYESALKHYDEMGRTFEAHKVPLGIKLSDEAVSRGDFDTSRRILADLAEELTSAGQFSQAANILRRSNDPEAATLFIQRQITKLNKDGAEQYGKKWNPVDLTDDELQAIKASAGDQTKYDAAMEGIYNRIAKQIPSSNREKFDAWRRMAMLMNPKTHVRNIVGNTLMKGLEKTSDTIANALEAIVRPAERTKAIGWSSDKNLVKTVQDSWETVKDDLTHASKYEISGLKAFNREKPIFKTKALEFMNQLSKSTLEAEDVFFMKGAYQDALGQYMKSNKLDVPNANAIEYAKNKATEATFRSANQLSNFIEGIKRKKGVAGIVAEAAIPFSKTPANILMRGVDYSPFGLIKLLASKDKTPAEIIDIISKGATGSALVGLGMMLADNGWARGDYTTAKKEGLAELTGEQPMSIITPQGSYTFDWAQPAAVPLAMGIAIQENLKRKNPDAAKIAIEAAAAGGDAIINMSMLQNLKDLMGGGFESPTENILSLPKQYLEQAFPSVVGQFARISDPKQRSNYADTEIQKAFNQIKSKTPGARQTLEPKIDILGREVSAGSLPTRIVQNLLSPGSIKKKDTEPVVLELSRLYESGRDTRIIPRVAPKTLERTVKGDKEEMKLTSEQLTKFKKSMGEANAKDLMSLFNSAQYKNASDEQKAKKVKNIVEDNYDEEKEKAFTSGKFY